MSKINFLRGGRRNVVIIYVPLFLILFLSPIAFGAPNQGAKAGIAEKVFRIQMPFIANEGQIGDEHVRFYATTFTGALYVTNRGEVVYVLSSSEPRTGREHLANIPMKTLLIREKLVGSSSLVPEGKEKAETKVNYFIGNDKNKWRTDIATYNEVGLGEVYQGIDLKLKAYGKNVEKIFTIKPGADSESIKLSVEGGNSLKINEIGELEVEAGIGTVKFTKPLAYQEINGKRHEVDVAYFLKHSTLDTQHPSPIYGFKVGDYDKSFSLIIDPGLSFYTFSGGAANDFGNGMAVDSSGNIYVVGHTTTGGTSSDAFVVQLNPTGESVVSSTVLGGTGDDKAYGIALDKNGSIYLTGSTTSSNFPGAPIRKSTDRDVFVTKLSTNGVILSRYLGGSGNDEGYAIAIDSDQNVNQNIYVTGYTKAQNFPTLNPYKQKNAGVQDAFVTKLNPSLTILFSTYLGGSDLDYGDGIAADDGANIFITGYTLSKEFPAFNGFQSSTAGGWDAYVTKLGYTGHCNARNPASDCYTLSYSTYLGETGNDYGHAIAVGSGFIYVTGETRSTRCPGTSAYVGGGSDAFVTKIDPIKSGGPSLVSSTCLGGSGEEAGYGIAADSSGRVYVTGSTASENFPTTEDAYSRENAGGVDAYFTILNPDFTQYYSTYLGGAGADEGNGMAISISGNVWSAYVTGYSSSDTFPPLNPLDGKTGGYDVFVAKFNNDSDGDGIPDEEDNCPTIPNGPLRGTCLGTGAVCQSTNDCSDCEMSQEDSDVDGVGDVCDNCPNAANVDQLDTDGDGYGEACDLCPKGVNHGGPGPCDARTATLVTASIFGPLITLTFTYFGEDPAEPTTHLVPPDCEGNTVFTSDPPIRTNCRRRPPYVMTVFEETAGSGIGYPGGDWVLAASGQSWTIRCNLLDIFDEKSLRAVPTVQITPMYSLLSGDRGIDPVTGNCVEGEICVDSQYSLLRAAVEAQPLTVETKGLVMIDIKPGTAPNSINLGSEGSVPVAILSTLGFDATTVYLPGVKFQEQTVVIRNNGTYQASNADANGDGLLDKVIHFYTQGLQITNGYEPACVKGTLNDELGQEFIGCDSVKIVP